MTSVFAKFLIANTKVSLLQPNFENFPIFPNFLRSQVLSRSPTCEATQIQCFLYSISFTTLLVVNRIYTEMLICFRILCPGLSVYFLPFLLRSIRTINLNVLNQSFVSFLIKKEYIFSCHLFTQFLS